VSLGQGLHQKLLQKLSPQQIQLMKLLQVPTANLEERIKEELEENPALEMGEEDDAMDTETVKDEFETNEEEDYTNEGEDSLDKDVDISEYIQDGDDEIADYKTKEDNYTSEDDNKTIPIKLETSFNELMLEQLNMLSLTDTEMLVAEQIIGSLDDDGYLRRETAAIANDLAFKQGLEVPETTIEKIIKDIQQFDPPGVAARNLQECLIIQLRKKEGTDKLATLAIKALSKYFEEFTKKHYEKIQRSLSLTNEDLKKLMVMITKLNPKPAGNIGDSSNAETYVIPDFFISSSNGKLELTLNNRNAPELKISEGYREMLRDYDKGSKNDKRQKDAVVFIKQKIDSAKWFIDAIKQRQNTLLLTMNAIMQHQYNFFLTGDETALKPMILKDIAEVTNLDISTVSRVANSKFVQTEFGTYRLKFFFSESLSTDSGEEVSTREVKRILNDIIEAENKNKPYSDELLTDMLQEKGYNIARRTVAKYREQLNIPVARLRKEL
jgi:RNA polymerase sigma-54 factor